MMPLEFGTTDMKGNNGIFGQPPEWLWSMKGSAVSSVYDEKGYPRQPDCFFGVGWLVIFPKHPLAVTTESDFVVRLGVESPRHDFNATLNALKGEIVRAFMKSDFNRLILAKGYACDERYLRRTDLAIRDSRNTTVFKIAPGHQHNWSSPEEAIGSVHGDLGKGANDVLLPFARRLNEYFSENTAARLPARC